MNEIPTPISDEWLSLFEGNPTAASAYESMQDLERRLTIAREALVQVDNWLMRGAQRKHIISEALKQIAP